MKAMDYPVSLEHVPLVLFNFVENVDLLRGDVKISPNETKHGYELYGEI